MAYPDTGAAGRSRHIPLLLLFVLLVLGTWARLVNAGSQASLWFDETWRIVSLLEAESLFRQIVSSPNHIDPHLFSLTIHLLAQLHNSELVLRLASIIPGVLAILAAYLVGRQLFHSRWTALLGSFFIAFSPWITIYSKELKPYSLGLLVHLSVLYGFLRYRRRSELRWKMLLAVTMLCALFFSPNIVFAFPGFCILMLVQPGEETNRRRFSSTLGACATMLAGTALYYAAFLQGAAFEQSVNTRTTFWFCPQETVTIAASCFFRRYLGFYSKMAFTDYSLFETVGAFLEVLYPLMALAGAVILLFRSRRRFLLFFSIFLLPLLVMVPFNILKLWPFGPLRMNLFLMAYIIFPPLFVLDEWHGRRPRLSRSLPVGLTAALLMALQFPVHFGDYSNSRVTLRKSAEALENIIEYNPNHPPIPLLVNKNGRPTFTYYRQHHHKVSRRFGACAGALEPQVLTCKDSPLYTTGKLLRECQNNRQVAIYMSQYSETDQLLFQNDFSDDHHSFDAYKTHSCILTSEIAGYEEDRQPIFSSKRFTGECDEWQVIHTSRPLPIPDPVPGTLVVVNFDLKFRSREKMVRFQFHGQDGSGISSVLSTIENEASNIPARLESAVHIKIREPIEELRLVISASGSYDFVMKNITCFATRVEEEKPAINPRVYPSRTGDRARVYGSVTALDHFWPDDQLSYGWTMGDATITLDGLMLDSEETVLLLETFGWMHAPWRNEMNRNGLRIYLNGDRRARFLGPGNDPVKHYYFEIPSDIHSIKSIRILSNTFNPRQLGLNEDPRTLGVDVKSVQFLAKTATEPDP